MALSARSAYRQLLRATRVAFRGQSSFSDTGGSLPLPLLLQTLTFHGLTDDARVLLASRQEARRNFDSHRREGVDTPMQINHAIEVANLLRHNLVQGVREGEKEDANWGRFLLFFGWLWCVMVIADDGNRAPHSRGY